ncbi:MAG: CoA-transferase [Candidatus Lernaella stagnicola]|nr:CoA-transferase [Candidatus Lernaella stagnicola]
MSDTQFEFPRQGCRTLIKAPDPAALRAVNRERNKALVDKRVSEDEAIERFVNEGDYLGFELYGTVRCPMSLTRALIRSGKTGFDLAGQGVHEADLLLAASLIKRIDCTYIGQEVYGVSPLLRREVESGRVEEVVEWSNGAITWRFKAAAMGLPFLPTYSMLGSDTFNYSAAKVIDCPFTGKPVALLPALVLNVGFIHVSRADKFGNCQVDGVSGFAAEMARASKKLIISTEEIVDTEVFRREPERTIIPWYNVDAVVHAPYGSWPGEMTGVYERDEEHYRMFLELVKTPEGTEQYMRQWVRDLPNHQALIEKIGADRLAAIRIDT